MIRDGDKRPYADILFAYQTLVVNKHGSAVRSWPLLNGWSLIQATFRGWLIVVVQDDAFNPMCRASGFGEISDDVVGCSSLSVNNLPEIRRRLEAYFNIGSRDALLLLPPEGDVDVELAYMMNRHEQTQGLVPMKVFLSHKGADKPRIREFKKTLEMLGFSPWLDEDSMRAGTELERGILNGFSESCAAVFFITPNFRDESFLSTEVNYALAEKRKKGDKFAIITIVFEATSRSNVPALLHQYVWKEPIGDLEALREIIAALPVRVGDVHWR